MLDSIILFKIERVLFLLDPNSLTISDTLNGGEENEIGLREQIESKPMAIH